MKEILIATTNPGKLKEISEALLDLVLSIKSLKDFPNLPPVQETGETFEANAILKARECSLETDLPTIADDSGFEIDALGGLPGVHTHRWIHKDRDSTDEEQVEYTLKSLQGIPEEKRTARIRSVVAFFIDGDVYTATGSIEGRVLEFAPKEILPGYPYRSLLFIPKFGKLYKDLTPEEHEQINHRIAAVNQLKPIIRERLEV